MSRQSRAELSERVHTGTRAFVQAIDVHQDAVAAYLGIGRTDLRCMDILDRFGPMTAGALAEASGLSTGAVTALIDRLERAGYAARIRDSVDRRRVLVANTPRGKGYADLAFARLSAETNALVTELPEEAVETIAAYLERGTKVVTENIRHVRELPVPPPYTAPATAPAELTV